LSETDTFYHLKYSSLPDSKELSKLFENPYKICGFMTLVYAFRDHSPFLAVNRILDNLESEMLELITDFNQSKVSKEQKEAILTAFRDIMVTMDQIENE